MTKIMFVCHGNICRSPMAEFIMKDLVKRAGLEDEFVIASAATSSEELGNPVYPPAKRILSEHGISCKGKTAVRLKPADYDEWDMFICMDSYNLRNIMYIFTDDPERKVTKLMSFTGSDADVDDPWYTRRFDIAFNEILAGCEALLTSLTDG